MVRACIASVVCCSMVYTPAVAQDEGGAASAGPKWFRTNGELTELPSSPDQWLNCSPLSLDKLEGKGILFYYFEEQCPNCEKRWPGLLEAAARHQGDPVIFIAVNSGNTPQQIAGYLKRNNINWPVIVDTDRSFEKESLGAEISLQNIYRLCTLTAKREWRGADSNQLDAVATAAAEGGKWNVDPTGIPDELRTAWANVEIGNYTVASRAIMRAGKQSNADTKAAAKKLFDAVKASMDEELATIDKQLAAGEDWPAYKALDQFMRVYDGYPMHPEVSKRYKEVGQSEAVKNERLAVKKVAAAIRAGSKNTPSAIKRAVGMLEKVVADFPDTEAAAEAQELLDKVAESRRTNAA